MGKRMQPAPGQLCECPSHPIGQPSLQVRRIYYDQRERFCYEWWCQNCYAVHELSEMENGWPTGEDGRFKAAIHCQVIPGLD
jgi:hypothetical protein